MRYLIGSIILSFLLSSCDSLKPLYYRHSDQLYKPITREKLYMPRAGGNGLRSEFQWERNYNRWFNYFILDYPTYYYNPYFADYWYRNNEWRFNNSWRLDIPRFIPPRYIPRKPKRVKSPVYRGQPRNTRVIAPSNTAGSTLQTPNTRTYERRKQNIPLPSDIGKGGRRFNQN